MRPAADSGKTFLHLYAGIGWRATQRLFNRLVSLRLTLAGLLQARANKITEQWMRTSGTTLKFGMELRGNKPGMVGQLNHLDQAVISRATAKDQTVGLHALAILVIELVAMA